MPLKLGARYRVVGPLASGGMGSVQLALRRGPDGDVPVAIKQLHEHLADDARMVAMFVDEARIASRLSHPNIVRVHDVEMIGEDVVIVMELIEGVPLSTVLRHLREEKTKMPLGVARRVLHDALLGLHAAHELRDDSGAPYGIVHRDVSPHNVLIGTDGIARIADFGIAKASGRLASTQPDGSVKGKLQYLAPEQIYRKDVDRKTDVFAAGNVLWECLAGRKLFGGENEGETLARVLTEEIMPPSSERFDIPLELDEACLRALERDPERRFPDANEFAKALEEGGLADRAEVAALVARAGAETLAQHRAQLEAAKNVSSRGVPEIASSEPRAPARPRSASRNALIAVALVAGGVGGAFITRMAPSAKTDSAPPSASTIVTTSSSAPAAPAVEAPVPGPVASTPPSAERAPLTAGAAAPRGSAKSPARAGSPRRRAPGADAGAARPFVPEDL